MKKSATVPSVPSVMPSGASNGLLLKFLGIFALILIILLIIYFATSRKRMENFANPTCSKKDMDYLKKQIDNAKCDTRDTLYKTQSKAFEELKSNLAQGQKQLSLMNDKSLSTTFDNYQKNILKQAEQLLSKEKKTLDKCSALIQEYKNCNAVTPPPVKVTPLPSPDPIEIEKIKLEITALQVKINELTQQHISIKQKIAADPKNVLLDAMLTSVELEIKMNQQKVEELQTKLKKLG